MATSQELFWQNLTKILKVGRQQQGSLLDDAGQPEAPGPVGVERVVQKLLDAPEAVVLIRVAVLHELDVSQLQGSDEQHCVLVVDVVVGDAVVDHEVLSPERLDLV